MFKPVLLFENTFKQYVTLPVRVCGAYKIVHMSCAVAAATKSNFVFFMFSFMFFPFIRKCFERKTFVFFAPMYLL